MFVRPPYELQGFPVVVFVGEVQAHLGFRVQGFRGFGVRSCRIASRLLGIDFG